MHFAKPFLLGVVVGVAVVVGALIAQPLVTPNRNQIPIQNTNGNFSTNINNVGLCPAIISEPITMQAYGFLNAKSGDILIGPNTTAFLKLNYLDTGPDVNFSSLNDRNSFLYLGRSLTTWDKLVGNHVNPAVKYNTSEIGLAGYVVNVTISPSYTNMSIIYEIVTTPHAVNGTYFSSFWGTCSNPAVTVESPYTNIT